MCREAEVKRLTTELKVMVSNTNDVLRQEIGTGRVLWQRFRHNVTQHLL